MIDPKSRYPASPELWPKRPVVKPAPPEEEDKDLPLSLSAARSSPAGALGMMAADDRLMRFVEDDIDRLEAEAETDRQAVERNRRQVGDGE